MGSLLCSVKDFLVNTICTFLEVEVAFLIFWFMLTRLFGTSTHSEFITSYFYKTNGFDSWVVHLMFFVACGLSSINRE